jgi:hypothetical protein
VPVPQAVARCGGLQRKCSVALRRGGKEKFFFFFDERGKEIGGPVKPQPAAGRTSETNL